MTQLLQKDPNAGVHGSAAHSGLAVQEQILGDQNQWAQEVRKADERCQVYHAQIM